MQVITPNPRPRRLTSLTPLIDVVFILLLFFMLATSFAKSNSISLQIPTSGGSTSIEGDLLIRILESNKLDVNGQTINLDELENAVAGFASKEDKPGVLVLPENSVPLHIVVRVFDTLNSVGLGRLSLGE
jgi:biopolymer transport protein ExbD